MQVERKDGQGHREQTVNGSRSAGGLGGTPKECSNIGTMTLGTGRIGCTFQINIRFLFPHDFGENQVRSKGRKTLRRGMHLALLCSVVSEG